MRVFPWAAVMWGKMLLQHFRTNDGGQEIVENDPTGSETGQSAECLPVNAL